MHEEGQAKYSERNFLILLLQYYCLLCPRQADALPTGQSGRSGIYHFVSKVVEGRFIFHISGHGSPEGELAIATSISKLICKERATRKNSQPAAARRVCVENGPATALLVGYVSI